MKTCELCGVPKADETFLKKDGKVSRACNTCRDKRRKQKIQQFYRGLPPDKRNTLTMRRRAKAYGVRSEDYSRLTILARWGHSCAYCDRPAEHLDHVHPLSRGGEDVESNILPACAACNLSKSNKTLAEWVESWREPPPF